jgi:hypothetical protein
MSQKVRNSGALKPIHSKQPMASCPVFTLEESEKVVELNWLKK